MIVVDNIPQVVYKKDIYTTGTFADVRKKVEPQVRNSECWYRVYSHNTTNVQEKLEPRVRQAIVADLPTPDRLREALDVVEIVLGFLSSGGGKADKSLGEYIDKTLKMKKRRFSKEVSTSGIELTRILFVMYSLAWFSGQEFLPAKTCFVPLGDHCS